jgi:hypothetical protein
MDPGTPGLESSSSRPFPRSRISGHLSHNQSVLAITHLPSREDPSSLPPPPGAIKGMCSSAVILQLESAIGARPKSSNDPWNFLLQVAKEVFDRYFRSPPHLSVSVSAPQPFDDEYRRTSSLSRGSTSESGAIISNPRSFQVLHR